MKVKCTIFLALFSIFATSGFFFLTVNLAYAACPDGIISYWKLEENGGPYVDSINGNDGTGNDAPTFTLDGRVNGAQDFDGLFDGIDVVPDGSFDWGNNESFSIEFWMKGIAGQTCVDAAPSGNEVMIGRDATSAGGDLQWWLGCQGATGNISFILQDRAGTADSVVLRPDPAQPINDGGWHHIVGVRDANNDVVRLYLDGVQVDEQTSAVFSAGFDSITAELNLGYLDLSPFFRFEGTLDEVAIYDKALSATQVQQHYNSGLGRDYCLDADDNCPNELVSFWALEENGGPYVDSIDGNDGTGNDAPTFTPDGRVNGAQDFDGLFDGIDVAPDGSFDWGNNESFSIEFWMKGIAGQTCVDAAPSGNEVMIGRDVTSAGGDLQWWLGCQGATGNISFILQDKSGTADSVVLRPDPAQPINDGGWHHIVGVRDANNDVVRLYLDGVQVDEQTSAVFSAGFDSATAELNLGYLDLSPFFRFEGTLDEVAMFDRLLTATEIQQHYNSGLGGLGARYCVDLDSDGISDGEENSGPNNGDGNQDGFPDATQNTVTTILTQDESDYVTLELINPTGETLSNCQAVDNPSPGDAPADTTFPFGFFEFTIEGVGMGGSAELNLILPQGQSLDTYYKYGPPLPGDPVEWYEFLDDGTTGATINDNEVTLLFVDGQRGDDMGADSTIVDQGGPAVSTGTPTTTSGGGGGGGCFIATAANGE